MRKHIRLLLGGAAALACVGAVQAAPIAPSQPLAAKSYSELLEPVPNAINALAQYELARASQPAPRLQLVQFHHHHHHHHHHNAFFPGAVLGGFLGGLAAGPAYYGYGPDYYGYDEPEYASPPVVVERGYRPSVAWCEQHYRSYDPETETYTGYDGRQHRCP